MVGTDGRSGGGVALPWPRGDAEPGRMARAAGAVVVLDAGELRLYLERGGRLLGAHGPRSASTRDGDSTQPSTFRRTSTRRVPNG
jgi:hypothetical protein